ITEDGSRQMPVMLHRAIVGSMERFIAILLEHYTGALPAWLAPVQAVVATIVSDADNYARELLAKLDDAGIRARLDIRNEKIGYKVREHSLAKVRYLLIVGRQESENRTVMLRQLGGQERSLSIDEAIVLL